jgi:hypothetical protein
MRLAMVNCLGSLWLKRAVCGRDLLMLMLVLVLVLMLVLVLVKNRVRLHSYNSNINGMIANPRPRLIVDCCFCGTFARYAISEWDGAIKITRYLFRNHFQEHCSF